MLTRFKSRGLAALLVLAGVTNVGLLGAQGPTRRGTTGARTPSLLSDCDITVGSCGGDPTFGEGGYNGTGVAGSGGATGGCGTGSRIECRRDKSWKCLKWVPLTVGANAGPTGGGGTTTMVCNESIETVVILYWP